nr:BTAD domain-containing putative transcriptional regulator [Angustibacter aerolatus]
MRIGYLGPLVVVDGEGRGVEVAGGRLRALLTRLAVDVGSPVPPRALVEAVWPDEQPADPAGALQSLVSRLRRLLGPGARLQQTPAGYRLESAAEPLVVDGAEPAPARGVRAPAAGRRSTPRGRRRAWPKPRRCGAASRSPTSTGRTPRRCVPRLADLADRAAADRVEARLRLGEAGEVLPELEALVAAHPLREDLLGRLLRALAALGRPAEALQAYERGRRLLADEPRQRPLARAAGPAPRAPARAGRADPAAHEPARVADLVRGPGRRRGPGRGAARRWSAGDRRGRRRLGQDPAGERGGGAQPAARAGRGVVRAGSHRSPTPTTWRSRCSTASGCATWRPPTTGPSAGAPRRRSACARTWPTPTASSWSTTASTSWGRSPTCSTTCSAPARGCAWSRPAASPRGRRRAACSR